ncbi:MAG TPA: hypothetical protein VGF16_12505 [Bryobacteraceae bacterium]|jgi:hypothetical protein
MLIKYASGLVQEGILISIQGNRLRVAPKNSDDLVEFQLVEGLWLSEDCEPVTFDLTPGVLLTIGFLPGKHELVPAVPTPYVN